MYNKNSLLKRNALVYKQKSMDYWGMSFQIDIFEPLLVKIFVQYMSVKTNIIIKVDRQEILLNWMNTLLGL